MENFRYFKEAVLQVIKDLNGEASLQEIYDKITDYWNFTPYQMEIIPRWGSERYKHDVCCALQGLKREGTIENPFRGIWRLCKMEGALQKREKAVLVKVRKTTKLHERDLVIRLRNEIQNVHSYLNGTPKINISDEKLVFWVWFCYSFGIYQEATSIFRRIDKNSISGDLYKIAEKINRVCEEKLI